MFAACGPEAQRLNTQISYDDRICLSLGEVKVNISSSLLLLLQIFSLRIACVYVVKYDRRPPIPVSDIISRTWMEPLDR